MTPLDLWTGRPLASAGTHCVRKTVWAAPLGPPTHIGMDFVSTGHQAKISQVPRVEFPTRRQRPVFSPAEEKREQCCVPSCPCAFALLQPQLLQALTVSSYNGLPSVTVSVLRTLAIRDALTLQGKESAEISPSPGPGPIRDRRGFPPWPEASCALKTCFSGWQK